MAATGLWNTVVREIRRMGSRKMYLFMMVVVPVGIFLFFAGLLAPGLPLKVPTAVVDLDHSPLSRRMIRNLDANELIDLTQFAESYTSASAAIRRGEIFGFFVIPENFEKNALSGKTPTLEYYTNLTYFVPGSLSFKGFKTISVITAAGLVSAKLTAAGLPQDMVGPLLQPISFQEHPIGNPWLNYSIYLSPSFCLGALALMIMLSTVFSLTMEIKEGTSRGWLAGARDSILVAVTGKLIPHFVVWSVVGQFMLALFFGYLHFPCGHPLVLSMAMELFVIANMAVALFICSVVPNPRLAFSLSALLCILSFSFLGFSFPVQSMYGAIAIFSYLVPTRYMFLTYIFSGLNGFPLYYSRLYIAALIAFPLVSMLLLPRFKKACLNPVYVP